MPPRRETQTSSLIVIAETTGRLVAPDEVVSRVENLVPTDDGGYASAYTPLPYQLTAVGARPGNGAAVAATPVYGDTRGIFHCLLQGGARDVLLLHVDNQVWVHDGSLPGWRVLIGPAASSPELEADLIDDDATTFPTQFVATPTGVIIIPYGCRAFFYDGYTVAPLGYDHAPAPPIGLGPESSEGSYSAASGQLVSGVNDTRYAMDALDDRPSAMHEVFKRCRIGTVTTPDIPSTDPDSATQVLGYLEPGRWRARVQWIDQWGNLSPLSGPSNDVVVERQPSTGYVNALPWAKWVSVDKVTKQFAWDGIAAGPDGTIGRILFRTKDLVNSGSAEYWELPLNTAAVGNAYATVPDNDSTMYPDNIPDAWLTSSPLDVVPVPLFRLAALWDGRVWIANTPDQPGLIRPSLVGRWGTFPAGLERYPDPTGAEITGLFPTSAGLIITTATSTFLLTKNDSGDDYKTVALTTTHGCVAPSSFATMANGITLWLSRDGFVAFDGSQVVPVWNERKRDARAITAGRNRGSVAVFDGRKGQYKCWVPEGGSPYNQLCWKYDGVAWHEERIVAASGACVTRDHRRLVLTCGRLIVDPAQGPRFDGVWVMDHGHNAVETGRFTTGWIRALSSNSRASIIRARLWLRETRKSTTDATKIAVTTRKNWRADDIDTKYVQPHLALSTQLDATPPPSFLTNSEAWGTVQARRRRPFWSAVDVHLPACETFQLEVSSDARFEIMGFVFDWQDLDDSGARL